MCLPSEFVHHGDLGAQAVLEVPFVAAFEVLLDVVKPTQSRVAGLGGEVPAGGKARDGLEWGGWVGGWVGLGRWLTL